MARSDLRSEVAAFSKLVSMVSRPLTQELRRACDLVFSGPLGRSVGIDEILSKWAQSRENELSRLLRCGESFGFVRHTPDGYSLSEPDPGSVASQEADRLWMQANAGSLRFDLDRWILNYQQVAGRLFKAENIIQAVCSGEPQWAAVFGSKVRTCFDLNKVDPELFLLFNEAMYQSNRLESRLFAASLSASRPIDVLDVGGGAGAWLDALAEEGVPLGRVVNYEFSETLLTIKEVRRSLKLPPAGFTYIAGDFFKAAPRHFGLVGLTPEEKFDLVSLNWILHDWKDKDCEQILNRVKRHLKPDGVLLVQEAVLPANRLGPGTLGDLMILLQTGGLERTESDFRRLFGSCNLSLGNIFDLGTRRKALAIQESV